MATVKCPVDGCANGVPGVPDNYTGTLQCPKCTKIIQVTVRNGWAVDARTRTIDLIPPNGLSEDLHNVMTEAITCFEVGAYASSVVMAGLFIEGLMKQAGMRGDTLDHMITNAHQEKLISNLCFHVATATRLMRNIGAHYSSELVRLSRSDARLALDLTRKVAEDVLASGKIGVSEP